MNYSTLLIDPPWRYKGPGWLGGAHRHYPTLPYEALKEIPIPEVLEENAQLWMWTTATHMEQAFQLLRDWKLEKKATFEWVKLRKHPLTSREIVEYEKKGKPIISIPKNGEFMSYGLAWPNGYYNRQVTEYLLLATQGKQLIPNDVRHRYNLLFAPSLEHSAKPVEGYNLVRDYGPERRLEMFSRSPVEGFDTWGNEAVGGITIPVLDEWSKWAQETFPEPRDKD